MHVSRGMGAGRCAGDGEHVCCSHGLSQGRATLPLTTRSQVSQDANHRRMQSTHAPPLHPSSPFLHLLSSISRCWITFFKVLFFSFSFSYFFFHSSAVSSRFTETVFLMVLALGLKTRGTDGKHGCEHSLNHEFLPPQDWDWGAGGPGTFTYLPLPSCVNGTTYS